jgi:hypothetical protein
LGRWCPLKPVRQAGSSRSREAVPRACAAAGIYCGAARRARPPAVHHDEAITTEAVVGSASAVELEGPPQAGAGAVLSSVVIRRIGRHWSPIARAYSPEKFRIIARLVWSSRPEANRTNASQSRKVASRSHFQCTARPAQPLSRVLAPLMVRSGEALPLAPEAYAVTLLGAPLLQR